MPLSLNLGTLSLGLDQSAGGGISDAPFNGDFYLRQNGSWVTPVSTNSSAPTLSGTVAVGSSISVNVGSWTGSPTGYSYQWQSSPDSTTWSDIGMQTSDSYTILTSDSGNYFRCQVTAINFWGNSDPVPTAPSGQVPILTLLSNLVLAAAFNGDASDSSGNGNDFSMTGSVPFVSDPSGSGNQCAYFDGSSDNYFTSELSLTGAWTIRCLFWTVPSGAASAGAPMLWDLLSTIAPSDNSGTMTSFYLEGGTSGRVIDYGGNDAGNFGENSMSAGDGVWNEIVVVNDPEAGLSGYLNGNLAFAPVNPSDRQFQFIVFGCAAFGSWNQAQRESYAKNFDVWNRALLPSEINAMVGLNFSSFGTTY
jgi:hypothetical protein